MDCWKGFFCLVNQLLIRQIDKYENLTTFCFSRIFFSNLKEMTWGRVVKKRVRDRAHNLLRLKILKDSSPRSWSRCWEKWERLFVWLDPGLTRRCHCLGHLLLLKPNKQTSLLLVLRYPINTLSTSVLKVPLFTTHDLLCLLWQSSLYSGILRELHRWEIQRCHTEQCQHIWGVEERQDTILRWCNEGQTD
jgi:hypothetical protein